MADNKFKEKTFSNNIFNLKRKYLKVIDQENNIIVGIRSKYIYDFYGNKIAIADETNADDSILKYISEEDVYIVKDSLFYKNDTQIGTIIQKEKDITSLLILFICSLILLSTLLIISLIEIPNYEAPTFNIVDSNGEWTSQGEIAVFDNSIFPGSSGEYKFIINNPHNVQLLYDIAIEELYNNEPIDNFPLEFRLRMNNGLLVTEEWLSSEELKYVDLNFLPNTSQSFTLEWRWLFENGVDSLDTYFGNDNGKYTLVFKLSAEIDVEE